MKWKLLVGLLLLPVLLEAQATVKGLVTEQNSGNKPIAGVQIKALGSAPEQTGNDGLFQLMFSGKKPGDRIIVSEISKRGYEIVNKDIVNNWLIPNNPSHMTKIVMCPEGMIAENTMRYYDISIANLTKSYTDQNKILQEKLNKSQIDNKTYGEQARILAEQFDQQQKKLEELSEKFARENFDDCSVIHKQAFEAFKLGDINGAIRILEAVNSRDEIAKAKKQKMKGKRVEEEGKEMQWSSDSIINQNIKKLIFQAELYVTEMRFEDAMKTYEIAIDADSTNYDVISKYATFLKNQNQYDLSVKWYKSAIAHAPTKYNMSEALIDLAIIQTDLELSNYAEENYIRALNIRHELVLKNNKEYNHALAEGFYQYAYYFQIMNKYDKMDSLLKKALAIEEYENKLNSDSEKYLMSLIYGSYAKMYTTVGNHSKAVQYCNESIKILKEIFEKNLEYKSDYANTVYELGWNQSYLKSKNEAEANLLEGLKISRDLVKINPIKFQRELYNSLNGIFNYYFQNNRYIEAKPYIEESVNILKELNKKYPVIYKYDMTVMLNQRAILEYKLDQYDNAESDYNESLEIMRELEEINPDKIKPFHALLLNNIAFLYRDMNNFEKAEMNFSESINLFKELAKDNPQVFNLNLARIYFQTGQKFYGRIGKFDKEKEYLLESLKIYREIAKTNPEEYDFQVANILTNLSGICKSLEQIEESVLYGEEAVKIFRKLVEASPQNYTKSLAEALITLTYSQYMIDLPGALKNGMEALTIFKQFEDSSANSKKPLAQCYSWLSRYLIMSERFKEAEEYARTGLKYEDRVDIKNNLAHSLLFQGEYEEAKKIYLEIKDIPADPPEKWSDIIIINFDYFEKKGITHPDMAKIRELLK